MACLPGTPASAQDSIPALPSPVPEIPRIDLPEDEIETLLQRSADDYEQKRRAKAGGALLEVAEIIESLAAPNAARLSAEVEAFRNLAVEAARGRLDPQVVDFTAARACIQLASLFHAQQQGRWKAGNPKESGRDWYRALLFLQRSIEWGGFGMQESGEQTLHSGKELAGGLVNGHPVDADEVRSAVQRTGRMINEVGRAIFSKAGDEWQPEPTEAPEAVQPDPRQASRFVQPASEKAAKKSAKRHWKLRDLFKPAAAGQ